MCAECHIDFRRKHLLEERTHFSMLRAFQFFGLCKPYKKALVSSIVRVDHAGELAADRIYAGQTAVLKNTDVGPVIQHMWDEEKEHLDITERLLAEHNVAPTLFTPIFKSMAYGLGFGSALLGKEGAMACTIAVEELITEHYNKQIKQLFELDSEDNVELLKLIRKMRDDEMHHHDLGVEYDGLKAPMYQALKTIIQTGCKGAIYTAERI